ncbi:MAG: SDR family NAD(P)-dependent oxidoreductase [Granulosicoccaceae bacterium]
MAERDFIDLQAKVALITGASSGLGAHFSRVLAARGCTVALMARRLQALQAVADEIKQAGGKALVLATDVTQLPALITSFDTILAQLGAVDIVINNAGIARGAPFLEATDADTADVFAVNQAAVWRVAQLACQQMQQAGKRGSVINIASVLGERVVKGLASYSTTKAAVIQMTRAMALEMAPYGIRVNAIAPGYCDTEINHEYLQSDSGHAMIERRVPMRRVAKLHELDGVLLLLASQQSSYITGATIPVDGGYMVGP